MIFFPRGRGSPLSLSHLGNLPRFVLSIWQSIRLFKVYKPDVLVALGGFAAATHGYCSAVAGDTGGDSGAEFGTGAGESSALAVGEGYISAVSQCPGKIYQYPGKVF